MSTTEMATDLDLSLYEQEVWEIPCEIPENPDGRIPHPGEGHPADWCVVKTCGCSAYICDSWFRSVRIWLSEGGLLYCLQCHQKGQGYRSWVPIRFQS